MRQTFAIRGLSCSLSACNGATRVFPQDQCLFIYLEAYQPAAEKTELRVASVGFYRRKVKAFETAPLKIATGLNAKSKAAPESYSVPHGKLHPGRYTCQVSVLNPSEQQLASTSFLLQPSIGSCLVTYMWWQPPLIGSSIFTPLDAGAQINVNGRYGSLALLRSGDSGSYFEPSGTSPAIVPSNGGTFRFDNGPGGSGVGASTAGLTESVTTPLVWTNSSAITAIDRAKGQSITWTGGIPGTYVNIFGYPIVYEPIPNPPDQAPYRIYFTCSAPLSAGQFTVPAAVLESLPPTGTALNNSRHRTCSTTSPSRTGARCWVPLITVWRHRPPECAKLR